MESSDVVAQMKRLITRYNTQMSRHRTRRVYCQECGVQVTVGGFADHLRDGHALECKTACPFCYARFTWRRGDLSTKLFVAQHRPRCLKAFLKTHRQAPASPPAVRYEGDETLLPVRPYPTIRPYTGPLPDPSPFCEICYDHHRHGVRQEMSGRVRGPWVSAFYEPFPDDPLFFRDSGPTHVRFSEESGLGLCAYNIFQCFLSGEYAFYHLILRAHVFWDFKARDWPGVHFLPYSTLCDGYHREDGEGEEERDAGRVHHRHMLVAMKRDDVAAFKLKWQQVAWQRPAARPVDRGGPVRRERNKLCVAIKDAAHLMYAIAYTSRPRGTCDGYGNADAASASGSHYWIFRALSPCAKIALACLWREGHGALVAKRHRESNLAVYYPFIERDTATQRWKVALQHLRMRERKCVIPFAREYEVCDDEPAAGDRPVVYLYGVVKSLRSVADLRQLPYDAWLRHQRAHGNSFWECVFGEWYSLDPYQTRCVNVVNAVREVLETCHAREKERMESRIGELKREVNAHVDAGVLVAREVQEVRAHMRTTQDHLKGVQRRYEERLGALQKEGQAAQKRYEEREKALNARIQQLEAELKDVL